MKKIKREDEDVRPARGGGNFISSLEIWRCLTGPHIVLNSLTGTSTVFQSSPVIFTGVGSNVERLRELDGLNARRSSESLTDAS